MTSKSDQENINRCYRIVNEYGAFQEANSNLLFILSRHFPARGRK